MLSKREARIVEWIVNGTLRRRWIMAIVFLAVLYGVFLVGLGRMEEKACRDVAKILAPARSSVAHIKTTTALENKLKSSFLQTHTALEVLIFSSLSLAFYGAAFMLFSSLFILCAFLFATASRDRIIKKLVDAQKFGPEKPL